MVSDRTELGLGSHAYHHASVRAYEAQLVSDPFDPIAMLVHEAVMPSAEQHEVVELGLAAVGRMVM